MTGHLKLKRVTRKKETRPERERERERSSDDKQINFQGHHHPSGRYFLFTVIDRRVGEARGVIKK